MHWQSDRLKVWTIHALSSVIHSYCCYRFSERVSVCFEGCAPIIGCTTCLKMLLPQVFFFFDKNDSFIVLAVSMMPNSSWEACSRPAGIEILCLLRSPKIYYLVHSSPLLSWDPVLSTCSCNVPVSSKWFVPSQVLRLKRMRLCLLHVVHFILLDLFNLIITRLVNSINYEAH
jgi:hypothetical protein